MLQVYILGLSSPDPNTRAWTHLFPCVKEVCDIIACSTWKVPRSPILSIGGADVGPHQVSSLARLADSHDRTRALSPHPQSDVSIGLALMDRFTSAMLDFFQSASNKQSNAAAGVARIRRISGVQPPAIGDDVSLCQCCG